MIQHKKDGSCKKAIIILGAENEFEGVDAEHEYLEELVEFLPKIKKHLIELRVEN